MDLATVLAGCSAVLSIAAVCGWLSSKANASKTPAPYTKESTITLDSENTAGLH